MTTSSTAVSDLVDAVLAHADSPGAAIVHNGRTVGYGELVERIHAVAAALGPSPNTVGVYTSRSPEVVIGLLGILAAGGAYSPIDPQFPAARRARMLAAVDCRTVLITGSEQVPAPGVRVIDLTDMPSAATEPVPAVPDDPAYVLFTSGSTGAPKPVVTSRRAIATTVAALRDLFDITPADRVLQFASLNWDTCLEEILPTLTAGATLVLDDQAHTGSFPRFLRMIGERGVTVLNLPTAFWHELVRHLTEEAARLPECLRLVVIGGEAAGPARLAEWHACDTAAVRLLNTYGCTETTLITHATDLGTAVEGPIPLGRALPHVVEHISTEGELLIGGPAVATGYLGLPEATNDRFVTIGTRRQFRTGDRVARAADGSLTHLGRLDDELKVRGVRVAPAEVEALIEAHPSVAAVAVTGTHVAARTLLVAYVVPMPHIDPATIRADLQRDLRSRAPAHLRPGRITVVNALAHTASGKVDRAETHRRYAPERADRRDDER